MGNGQALPIWVTCLCPSPDASAVEAVPGGGPRTASLSGALMGRGAGPCQDPVRLGDKGPGWWLAGRLSGQGLGGVGVCGLVSG